MLSKSVLSSLLIATGVAAFPTYIGCVSDSGSSRTLSAYTTTSESMTNPLCQSTCSGFGYIYAGTEYGDECWCGNSIAGATIDPVDGDCNGPCAGDTTTKCGATFRLSVYQLAATPTSTSTTTTSTSTSSAPSATYTGVMMSRGCFTDSAASPVVTGTAYSFTDSNMSNELCSGVCSARGNLFSGTEGGTKCYCGNYYTNAVAAPATDCNIACPGNSAEVCGGTLRLSMYLVTTG
ncbi:hypothetical protein FRB94_010872 [Tulasnella sp. JGI-2019a]|nr:hypothetical protein FRB93_006208 [Tulasnella sp. JGI-2019a]KAG8993280.1 hypothetical protein FRB94_010872 [Tulasnella sp. JGI-2019a]KAG9025038.1 hypothetical protein FRB95_010611 [Tulasnella sp. JGI-2019a]